MVFYRYNQYRYFDPNFIENHLKWEMILELKNKFLTYEKKLTNFDCFCCCLFV